MATAPVYCINHPKTETLLRCNKCGNPVCIKCVVRTPVGYRCKTCLNLQHAGYYNATSIDYVLVLVVGIVASTIGGAIALALSGFWFINIFYGPAAGGAIAEVIRRSVQRRRGKYLALASALTVVLGALVIVGGLRLPLLIAGLTQPEFLPVVAGSMLRGLFNIGLLIYLVLAVGTVYARLRS